MQIISDIHLELLGRFTYKDYKDNGFDIFFSKDVEKNILVMAGDIGNPFSEVYDDFISYCAESWNHVILISGNHEYYTHGMGINQTNKKIRRVVSSYDNVHFLGVDSMLDRENVSVTIKQEKQDDKKIKFIGTTLWSVPPTRKEFWERKERYATVNDFSCISSYSRDMYKQNHLTHKDILKKEIASAKDDEEIVIVTHHLPCREMIKGGKHNPHSIFAKYYYSDCNDVMDMLSKKATWICGHTHMRNHHTYKNVNIHCNPFGYKDEDTDYDKSFVITL